MELIRLGHVARVTVAFLQFREYFGNPAFRTDGLTKAKLGRVARVTSHALPHLHNIMRKGATLNSSPEPKP